MARDRAESKYFTVDPGIELHYWDKGEGDTIVFIPGLSYSGEIFKHQIDHFSKTHRVIAVDPRGQGLSTKTVHGNDYVTHGADLIKLVDGLGLRNVVLVGWSTGNLEVWSYLKQHGYDNVKGAVTIDMSPLPMNPDPHAWTEGSIPELSQAASEILTNPEGASEFWYEYLTQVMLQHKAEPDELEYLLDMGRRTPYWIVHELFCNAVFSNYLDTAKEASEHIPTLMYIAEHWADVAEPWYHKECPETPTYVMGGHLMAYEYPDKFNTRLDQFLESIDK
ncbi:alpha/beta hydrolase [Bifidobacterium sp. SO4]|uniref:alpha/beta fold hydrolase n=1 Tax=Bifidobacterium sp. SO4 TaxID=2809030 RepID=UPI001BDD34F6|nr:alpha/beta hydrolase [Bifidobacterium sp. SO4]MBT1170672.1 alpha/beta hydrolase [Bifidobacterium sp. SO4]